jgi:hypothetical protein
MSVYNARADFLRSAVESILAQSCDQFELILIDDGAERQIKNVLREYTDRRIRLIMHEENLGLARSLNEGITLARGKYLARQDADDVSMAMRIERQVKFLEANPDVVLLGTAFQVIDERERKLSIVRMGEQDEDLRRLLLSKNCFCHGSVMMRRDAVIQVGGYRELETCQDYDLWLRLAERSRIANLPDPLYHWRLTGSAVSIRKAMTQTAHVALVQRMAAERRTSGTDRFHEYAKHSVEGEQDHRESLWGFPMKEPAAVHLLQSARLFAYGDPLGAMRSGLKGLAADPLNRRLWSLLLTRPVARMTERMLMRNP